MLNLTIKVRYYHVCSCFSLRICLNWLLHLYNMRLHVICRTKLEMARHFRDFTIMDFGWHHKPVNNLTFTALYSISNYKIWKELASRTASAAHKEGAIINNVVRTFDIKSKSIEILYFIKQRIVRTSVWWPHTVPRVS